MKKIAIILGVFSVVGFTSCKKCAECHYDTPTGEVELEGEYCGDDLENIEANGYTLNGVVYTVHCGEDH